MTLRRPGTTLAEVIDIGLDAIDRGKWPNEARPALLAALGHEQTESAA